MNSSTAKANQFYLFLVFLISPLLSVFLAARNYKFSWGKNIIWFFVIFYAISFSIPSETSDANDYKLMLEDFHHRDVALADVVSNLYTTTPNYNFIRPFDDAVQPLLTYFVAQYTDNWRVLYFFVGLIFGFFYSRNIWFLIETIQVKIKPIHVLIILSFALVIPFWQLNSIRMWTAAHVFFYGAVIFILKERKVAGALLMVASSFFHFSFLLPIFSFVIYLVAGNRTTIYFYFFLFSFFVNEIDLGTVRVILQSVLPDFFHRRVETYTPGELVVVSTNKSWHAVYYTKILKWTIFFCIITLYTYFKNKIEQYPKLHKMFSFSLLFLTIANFSSLVPAGGRFLNVGYLFAFTSLFYSIQHFEDIKKVRNVFNFISIGLIFYCIVALRVGFDSINVGLFGNLFTLFILGEVDTTIINFIK